MIDNNIEFETMVYDSLGHSDKVEAFLNLQRQFNSEHKDKYLNLETPVMLDDQDAIIDDVNAAMINFLQKSAVILGEDDFFKLFDMPVSEIDHFGFPKLGTF